MKFVELLRYRHYKVRSIALNITSFGFNVMVSLALWRRAPAAPAWLLMPSLAKPSETGKR